MRVQAALEQWERAEEALEILLPRVGQSFQPADVRLRRELLKHKVE